MSVLNYLLSKSFFKTSFRIILTAFIFFIVLVVFLRLNTRHGDFILVPDLIGKAIDEFESELVELDLKYIISDSGNYNPEFKINSVLDQIPNANSKVKQGRKIYLTLNASDFKMVEIPRIESHWGSINNFSRLGTPFLFSSSTSCQRKAVIQRASKTWAKLCLI